MIADFNGPLPSWDTPFALMRACHRRIEQRLGLLHGLAFRLADPDASVRAQALAVLQSVHAFLSTVGIHHTADEEEDLYPMLRETGDPECIRALDELEQDHMRLEPILVAFDRLAGRMIATEALDAESVAELGRLMGTMDELYRAHLRHEEGTLYPKAEVLLTPEQIAQLSQGMRDRRGIRLAVIPPGASAPFGAS